jgi:hypothetical protein
MDGSKAVLILGVVPRSEVFQARGRTRVRIICARPLDCRASCSLVNPSGIWWTQSAKVDERRCGVFTSSHLPCQHFVKLNGLRRCRRAAASGVLYVPSSPAERHRQFSTASETNGQPDGDDGCL